LASIESRYERKYGHGSASSARFKPHEEVTSTGILSLDLALGVGGWPEGVLAEVYGPRDIGKTSTIGFSALKEAQKAGKYCALIALEPSFDPRWAEKNGVDLDKLLILWPDDGKKAFDMLFDLVLDDEIQFIIFDSIGALLRESEAGDKGKPSQGGQSALITWGVKRVQMPAWKRKKTIIFINQIRDDMDSMFGGVKPPGGHALEHTAEIHVQLKPGADRYMIKEGTGKEAHDVMVGRTVVAVVARNKRNEGTNQRAYFDFFQKETDQYPFGVDRIKDTINTAKRVGIIRAGGAWLYHDLFPEGKINGYDAAYAYLQENPEVEESVREAVRATVTVGEGTDISDKNTSNGGSGE
jgi:recombination protein RecA